MGYRARSVGASVTRNAPAGAATFSATVTVVDGSGNTASDKATVAVGAGSGVGLQPSYTLTLVNDPSNTLSVPRGGSASVVIALNGVNGYADQPTLLAGPAPPGISVSFPYGARGDGGECDGGDCGRCDGDDGAICAADHRQRWDELPAGFRDDFRDGHGRGVERDLIGGLFEYRSGGAYGDDGDAGGKRYGRRGSVFV